MKNIILASIITLGSCSNINTNKNIISKKSFEEYKKKNKDIKLDYDYIEKHHNSKQYIFNKNRTGKWYEFWKNLNKQFSPISFFKDRVFRDNICPSKVINQLIKQCKSSEESKEGDNVDESLVNNREEEKVETISRVDLDSNVIKDEAGKATPFDQIAPILKTKDTKLKNKKIKNKPSKNSNSTCFIPKQIKIPNNDCNNLQLVKYVDNSKKNYINDLLPNCSNRIKSIKYDNSIFHNKYNSPPPKSLQMVLYNPHRNKLKPSPILKNLLLNKNTKITYFDDMTNISTKKEDTSENDEKEDLQVKDISPGKVRKDKYRKVTLLGKIINKYTQETFLSNDIVNMISGYLQQDNKLLLDYLGHKKLKDNDYYNTDSEKIDKNKLSRDINHILCNIRNYLSRNDENGKEVLFYFLKFLNTNIFYKKTIDNIYSEYAKKSKYINISDEISPEALKSLFKINIESLNIYTIENLTLLKSVNLGIMYKLFQDIKNENLENLTLSKQIENIKNLDNTAINEYFNKIEQIFHACGINNYCNLKDQLSLNKMIKDESNFEGQLSRTKDNEKKFIIIKNKFKALPKEAKVFFLCELMKFKCVRTYEITKKIFEHFKTIYFQNRLMLVDTYWFNFLYLHLNISNETSKLKFVKDYFCVSMSEDCVVGLSIMLTESELINIDDKIKDLDLSKINNIDLEEEYTRIYNEKIRPYFPLQ